MNADIEMLRNLWGNRTLFISMSCPCFFIHPPNEITISIGNIPWALTDMTMNPSTKCSNYGNVQIGRERCGKGLTYRRVYNLLLMLYIYLFMTTTTNTGNNLKRSTFSIWSNNSRWKHCVPNISLIPSMFVMADDTPLIERRAKFVLDTRKRRRRLYETSVKQHYASHGVNDNDPDEEHDENTDESCLYRTFLDEKREKPWTYEICPKQKVRRMNLTPLSSSSSAATGLKYGLLEVGDEKYAIKDVERLGMYSSPEQFDKDIFNNVVNTLWGKEEIHSNSSPSSDDQESATQYYIGGDICVDDPSIFNAAKVTTQGCCQDTSSSNQGRKVVKVDEEDPCRFTLHLCNFCSNDGATPIDKNAGTQLSAHERSSLVDTFTLESDANRPNKERRMNTDSSESWLRLLERSLPGSFPPMPPSLIRSNIDKIKNMFQHAYDSYMYHAYPAGSEIKPISCKPALFDLIRLPALTLIDSLDTLLIMNNHTEFARSVERLRILDGTMRSTQPWTNSLERGGLFAVDQNVSVFETNIRVLGGLLSAHQMAEVWTDEKVPLNHVFHSENEEVLIGEIPVATMACAFEGDNVCTDQKGDGEATCVPKKSVENGKRCIKNVTDTPVTNFWKYDGFLLKLAEDIGRRLLPAFKTPTGIPYGTINLLYGVPEGETMVASLAAGGTLSIEMELLSRLVNNDVFGQAAKLSTRALWSRRSKLDLLGKHISVDSGIWTEQTSGIGSNSDSFYEYLIKHHILFPEDEDFFTMFNNTYSGVHRNAKLGDWYPDVPMQTGLSAPTTVFESLASFFPGMQTLLGEINSAARSTNSFTIAREFLDFLPERFDFGMFDAIRQHALYPLRPELYESTYFLHLATKDLGKGNKSAWLWSSEFFLNTLEKLTRVKCGYCSVSNISSKSLKLKLVDDMPSYFLSETLKYLYLTFDTDNPINTDKERNWVFTTEAHPVHSVPKASTQSAKNIPSSEEEKWLDDSVAKVSRVLGVLINSKSDPSNANPIPYVPPRPVRYLQQEKWSQQTSKYMHVKDLNKAFSATYTNMKDVEGKQIFGRIVNIPKKLVELDAQEDQVVNFAFLEHNLRGRGTALSKSCPNFHHSNALWINAFAGDDLNYGETFESTTATDNAMIKMKHKLPSALTASALFGTSYFSTNSPRCVKQSKKMEYTSQDAKSPPGTQRVDMGGDLGSFDVQMHPEGAGFYVRHEKSGETVEVTIVEPQDSLSTDSETFVAVDSYTPFEIGGNKKNFLDRSIDSSISMLKSMFTLNEPIPFKTGSHRSVIIADMNGHSFECKVVVKSRVIDGGIDGDEPHFQAIKSFPCLPATFGPTAMESLLSFGDDGISHESMAQKPDEDDPYGCEKDVHTNTNVLDDESLETNLTPSIQLLRRGQCNFVEKSLYASKTKNAKAVVIVNNEERGMFIMASSPPPKHLTEVEEPISVLVSKHDGDKIIELMEEHEEGDIVTNVSILPQTNYAKVTEESPKGALDVTKWPLVSSSPDSVQVYASGGWGVGVQQVNSMWQVVLLQHSFHTGTGTKL